MTTTPTTNPEPTPQEQDTRRQHLPPEKFPSQYTNEELFDHHIAKLSGQNDILKTSQKDIDAARKAMLKIIEANVAKIINTFADAALFAPLEIRILFTYNSDKEKTEAYLYHTDWPTSA